MFKLKSLRRRPAFLGVIVILAVSGVGGGHLTSRTSFCGACHEMKTVYAGWTESPHARTHCYACHADKGVLGAVKSKAQGLRELLVHLTGRVNMEQVNAVVPARRCVACHDMNNLAKLGERIVNAHQKHLAAKLDCVTCHAVSGHTRAGFDGFGSSSCNPCHSTRHNVTLTPFIHKTPCTRQDTTTTASRAVVLSR